MLPSASLGAKDANGKQPALYEPIHGSAPDIAGQGLANPIACILSFAMCLRYSFGRGDDAKLLEKAVERVLAEGYRTADIMQPGMTKVGTTAMTDAILKALGVAQLRLDHHFADDAAVLASVRMRRRRASSGSARGCAGSDLFLGQQLHDRRTCSRGPSRELAAIFAGAHADDRIAFDQRHVHADRGMRPLVKPMIASRPSKAMQRVEFVEHIAADRIVDHVRAAPRR